MIRVDYFHDPNAPAANSIVPAVSVVVTDAGGRVLMVHRTDNNRWALPGGGIEVGESVKQAAAREVKEESGIDITVTGIVGVFSNPAHVAAYDDGEVRQEFSICLSADALGGDCRPSEETSEVRFVSKSELSDLDLHPSMRLRIAQFLQKREPYLD